MIKTKPFSISKRDVLMAYRQVKMKKGTGGADGQTIEDFEKDLKNNLYKIWNRMSSGSYIPPAVLRVEIPKGRNETRPLGIPTISDRIAQTVAKMQIEPDLEKIFCEESYGYRPKRSAMDALGRARQNCWKYSWVIDLDIKAFFDNIDHELLMKAVEKHVKEKWIILYIKRWLTAPIQHSDGIETIPEKGTPQGGVISPLLANLFLHYTFDLWLKRNYPEVPFERFADDVIVHCKTEKQAKEIRIEIEKRLEECKLKLHPEKTRIVYCKDCNRTEEHPNISFDFLGYTFKPRKSKNKKGKIFLGFSPAISKKSKRRIMEQIRKWKLHRRSDLTIREIADKINPVVRGWMNYYGKYYKSELYEILFNLNKILIRWARRKYKKLRTSKKRALEMWRRIARRDQKLFAHWAMSIGIKVDC